MEMSCKRKFDCTVDNMNVVVPDSPSMEFYSIASSNKKVKLSLNARLEPYVYPDSSCTEVDHDHFMVGDFYRSTNSVCGSVQMEDEGKSVFADSTRVTYSGDDDDMEDIPSASEVIDSLRKVMLWMSAQEDNNTDHIQYLSNVERYAISKRDSFIQQRKITEFFIKH